MAEIEFEDSSITVVTQRTQVPLHQKGSTHHIPKSTSYYEGPRESLDKSIIESRSSQQYGSIAQLKNMLPNLTPPKILSLLLHAVQETEILEVQAILDYYAQLEQPPTIIEIRDQKQQTLAHIASFKNSPSLVEKLLIYETNKVKTPENQILEWLDCWNVDTFSAIHFAAYVGSIQTMETLILYGANLQIKNQQGQNSLAIAAQGDQVLAMVWLQIQGLSFCETDAKGGTPLHWATYYGSEFAVLFLLSWICKAPNSKNLINQQDHEGMTPLHLAAMTGNIRITKKLLLRGADKSIKDQKGTTPAEEALASQYDHIYQLLEKSNWLYEFLNIKTSFKSPSISWGQILSFFFLYFYCMCGTIAFVYPFLHSEHIIQFVSIGLFSLGIVFYILTWCISPGTVAINTDQKQLFNLLTNYEPWELCAECQILKPKRSRHCEFCRKCIIVYDHHCPWLNNCIGANNHAYFMCFIIMVLLNLLHILVLNAMYIGDKQDKTNSTYPWFNQWINSQYSETLYIVQLTVQASIIIICFTFIAPMTYLVYVQICNLLTDRTTFENNKQEGNNKQKKQNSQLSESSQSSAGKSKQQQYSCNNCLQMCCYNRNNPQYRN